MRMHAAFLPSASLVVLLAIPSTAYAGKPKACNLLDAQTAVSIVGSPVSTPIDMQGMGCVYQTTSGSETVELVMVDSAGTDGAITMRNLQMVSAQSQGTTTESIPSLGEQNFLLVRNSNLNGLMVLYHQKMFTLSVQKHMTPDVKAAMVQAMRQVLSRM